MRLVYFSIAKMKSQGLFITFSCYFPGVLLYLPRKTPWKEVVAVKNRTWALILGAVLAVSIGVSVFFLLPSATALRAEIWSDGERIETVSLARNRTFTVQTQFGSNVITIQDGKIAVTEASCPDHYCMHRGYCHGGLPIVCLPNRLEIRFLQDSGVDGAVG